MKNFTLLLLTLFTLNTFAQKEANNWYFGVNAGIRFLDDGSVQALSDGAMSTNEGCSSISDQNFNLLFYTDGRTVWDRNHVIMPNGDYMGGTGLLGDPSSTQSGIIVPKKGDPNIYYIFTVDEPHHGNAAFFPEQFPPGNLYDNGGMIPDVDDGFNNGFNYSIADLSVAGENGSIGDVVTRNVHLTTYNPVITEEASYKCSEKITAVKSGDGSGYWVITHFIDKFYAFSVDENGVNETPVITQITPVIPYTGYRRNAIGCLKASPDGDRLVVAHMQKSTFTGQASMDGTVYLYNFDNTTGIVSSPLQISNNTLPYGVEFSPSGNKLYVSYDFNNVGFGGVQQYDLQSNNIPLSAIMVGNTTQSGTLQLGPNGKIYRAVLNEPFLDVIENPEETGALCGYQLNAVTLAPGTISFFGLPPFITSFFSALIDVQNLCLGDATQFSLDVNDEFDTISWDFGDGSAPSTDVNPVHTYAVIGNYTVIASITREGEVFNFQKNIKIHEVPVANMAADLTECDTNLDDAASFTLSDNTAAILGTQDPDDYDVFYFNSQQDAEAGTASLNEDGYTNTVNPQTIYARIQNKANNACYDIITFEITALPVADIDTQDQAKVCLNTGDSVTITAGTNNPQFSYLWSTGATTSTINVNQPGTYTVTVTNETGCPVMRTVTVTPSDVAVIENVDVIDLTGNNTVTVHVTPSNNVNTTYLYSLDMPNGPFQQSNFFANVEPGLHTVYVYDENGCGVVSKDISVLFIPKFFTPNGDGTNDTWDIVGMNALFYQSSSIDIYDRFGKLVASVDPKGNGWDGNYNGYALPSTDYWYVVTLENGRVIKGHFSMVR